MKITFACPSCGAAGSLDSAFIGKQVRCRPCGHRFPIPIPGAVGPEPEIYAMEEPARETPIVVALGPPPESVYVSSPGAEPISGAKPRGPKRATPGSTSRSPRKRTSGFAPRAWMVRRGAVAVFLLTAIALLAPRGTLIAGLTLVVLGSILVLVGYAAGAYGAFSEDFIYGVLYLVVPLYTAYYLITRWDDLRAWFACSTAGVVLVLLGVELIRWSGAVA